LSRVALSSGANLALLAVSDQANDKLADFNRLHAFTPCASARRRRVTLSDLLPVSGPRR
jgi:hypothetical protein